MARHKAATFVEIVGPELTILPGQGADVKQVLGFNLVAMAHDDVGKGYLFERAFPSGAQIIVEVPGGALLGVIVPLRVQRRQVTGALFEFMDALGKLHALPR